MIHLLSIGNNYPASASELYGCVNDAKDTADEFKPWLASAKTIANSKADHPGIFKEGRTFLERLEPGDLGIISNSSHGTREKISGAWHEAIVCADFELIYDREFDALLSARAEGSYLAVFSDSCHAGGLPRGGSFAAAVPKFAAVTRQPKTIPLSRCSTHKLADRSTMRALKNVIYFSGCKETEYSYDATFDGRPNGAMTYYLLKAFRERKQNTTFGQLFAKLAGKRPRGYLPTDEYPQTPIVVASAKNLKRTLKSFTVERV
jgi:hypothetical protein